MPEAVTDSPAPIEAGEETPDAPSPDRGECCQPIVAVTPGLALDSARHQRVPVIVAAAAMSLMLHAAVGYALMLRLSASEMEGAGGQYEGISVELVAGTAVEGVAGTSQAQAEAVTQISDSAGEDAPKDQVALNASDTAAQEKTEPAPPESITPNETPEIVAQPKPVEKTNETAPKTDSGEGEAQVKQPTQDNLTVGGAASRGASQSSAAVQASVAASPGEMSRYAVGLYAAIMRKRPLHAGHSGSVTILFALTPTGQLRSADVFKSNGDVHLEHLALDTIRRVHFPPPPPRANEGQLWYKTTIKFR